MQGFKNEFTYRNFLDLGKEAEFDSLFDNAVEKVKKEYFGKKYPIIINGEEIYLQNELIEKSPINGLVLGIFQKGSKSEIKAAIESANKTFEEWSQVDYKKRASIFRKAAKNISDKKFEFAAVLSFENGKTRYESMGEVDEAIDFINYYCNELERNKGFIRKSIISGTQSKVESGFQGAPGKEEKVKILMKPYGVFGVIAPFNFPVSISTGMSTGAMITGNTIVFKPSSTDNMTMLTGYLLYKAFSNAGLPSGVFNYVTGPGSELGSELSTNKLVKGIAFTGSRTVGISMINSSYSLGNQMIFVVEMGGKNPVIVSKYANIDVAVSGISSAAFGYSGQKCSAASRVYVHNDVKDEFIKKLLEKVSLFKIGDPIKKENFIGPLISNSSLIRYKESVEEVKKSGKLYIGGNVLDLGMSGCFVEPVVAEVPKDNQLFKNELFLPFLLITSFTEIEEAIKDSNNTPYGLTAGFYSERRAEVKYFLKNIEAGVIYVNREISATTGAIVGFHTFVGWKGSGLTGKGTGSKFYLEQFMREQSQAIVE
ncbi:MAG: aldehyde dehydrogenase family protein [Candidatus Micrarchaeaceae archaeon]